MKMSPAIKFILWLFLLGFLGVLSTASLIPQILAQQGIATPMPVKILQLISVAQSSVLLLAMILLGRIVSKKVGLHAPVIFALSRSENVLPVLKPQIKPALIGGICGGVFIVVFASLLSRFLPADFISAGERLVIPWYTKVLYGGITEELLIRWGVMSFLVWASYRVTQKHGTDVRSYNYIIAIVISALIFGLGHLPVAFALSAEITIPLVIYIILGNAAFGLVAGYLYWKNGLECAIGAHIFAHITMISAASLT